MCGYWQIKARQCWLRARRFRGDGLRRAELSCGCGHLKKPLASPLEDFAHGCVQLEGGILFGRRSVHK